MPARKKISPETMFAPETGQTLTRGVRSFGVVSKSERIAVDLPGYYPVGAGDGVHVCDDRQTIDDALGALKEKREGIPMPATSCDLRRRR
jgi:HTH-type transcriptional regulator/antitoxin MqsA